MPARVDFRPEPELMCFGKMVKQAREQMGISQDQLAEKVGISVGYVGAIERKRDQRPSFDVAFKICKVLNISLDRILFPAESREHSKRERSAEAKDRSMRPLRNRAAGSNIYRHTCLPPIF